MAEEKKRSLGKSMGIGAGVGAAGSGAALAGGYTYDMAKFRESLKKFPKTHSFERMINNAVVGSVIRAAYTAATPPVLLAGAVVGAGAGAAAYGVHHKLHTKKAEAILEKLSGRSLIKGMDAVAESALRNVNFKGSISRAIQPGRAIRKGKCFLCGTKTGDLTKDICPTCETDFPVKTAAHEGAIKMVAKGVGKTIQYMGKQFMKTPKTSIAIGSAAAALAVAPHKGPLSPVHHRTKE